MKFQVEAHLSTYLVTPVLDVKIAKSACGSYDQHISSNFILRAHG